jgi:hypothetical protein
MAWEEWSIENYHRVYKARKISWNNQAGIVVNKNFLLTAVPQKVVKLKPKIRKVLTEQGEEKLFLHYKRKIELELMEIKKYNYQCTVCHVVFSPEQFNNMQWGHRKEHPRNGADNQLVSKLVDYGYSIDRLKKEFAHVVLMCVTCNLQKREKELGDCQCRCCCLPSSSSSSSSSSSISSSLSISHSSKLNESKYSQTSISTYFSTTMKK